MISLELLLITLYVCGYLSCAIQLIALEGKDARELVYQGIYHVPSLLTFVLILLSSLLRPFVLAVRTIQIARE